jgi:hypothetical protein
MTSKYLMVVNGMCIVKYSRQKTFVRYIPWTTFWTGKNKNMSLYTYHKLIKVKTYFLAIIEFDVIGSRLTTIALLQCCASDLWRWLICSVGLQFEVVGWNRSVRPPNCPIDMSCWDLVIIPFKLLLYYIGCIPVVYIYITSFQPGVSYRMK